MPATSSVPNIYLVGTQSTGKTTIVDQLKLKLPAMCPDLAIDEPHFITEVARTVLRQHPIATEDIRSSAEKSLALQERILRAQARSERGASAQHSWFVSDRSSADPIVYATKYAGPEAARQMQSSPDWIEAREKMGKGLVVVCEAGVTWLTDDGTRLMPKDDEDWLAFHQLFLSTLDRASVPYHVLPRTVVGLEDRVDFVLTRWKDFEPPQ